MGKRKGFQFLIETKTMVNEKMGISNNTKHGKRFNIILMATIMMIICGN